VLLYFQCGLRFAEALAVTPRSWNQEARTVSVNVKGGRTRPTPITPDVEVLLASAGNPDPDMPFIFALRGRKMNIRSIRAAWQKHKRDCAINPAVTSHDLRRTAASIIYASSHDLRAVQALLGHKRLTSTLQYIAPLAPEEAQKYQELLRFDHFHSEVKQ
jgi:integrase/recombinase XerC